MERVWGKILVVGLIAVLGNAQGAQAGFGNAVVSGVKVKQASKGSAKDVADSIAQVCRAQKLKCDVPSGWEAGVSSVTVAETLKKIATDNKLDQKKFENFVRTFANETDDQGDGGFLGLGGSKKDRDAFLRETGSNLGVMLQPKEGGGYAATTTGNQMNDVYKQNESARDNSEAGLKARASKITKALCPGGKCILGLNARQVGDFCYNQGQVTKADECIAEVKEEIAARLQSANEGNVEKYKAELESFGKTLGTLEPELSKDFVKNTLSAAPPIFQSVTKIENVARDQAQKIKDAVGTGKDVLCSRPRGEVAQGLCEAVYNSSVAGKELIQERLEDLSTALQNCATAPGSVTPQACASAAFAKAKLGEDDLKKLTTDTKALNAYLSIVERVAPTLDKAQGDKARELAALAKDSYLSGKAVAGTDAADIVKQLEQYRCEYASDSPAQVISAPIADNGSSCSVPAVGSKKKAACRVQLCQAKVRCVKRDGTPPVLSFSTACSVQEVSGAGCGGKVEGREQADAGVIAKDLQKCFASQVTIAKPINTPNKDGRSVTTTSNTQGAF